MRVTQEKKEKMVAAISQYMSDQVKLQEQKIAQKAREAQIAQSAQSNQSGPAIDNEIMQKMKQTQKIYMIGAQYLIREVGNEAQAEVIL